MNALQLRLLPPPKPLSERFGRQFFREVPRSPGVYLMFGAKGELLYVGQSANLRKRVGSYRYLKPERSSRKLIRLVHSVQQIQWQVCESPEASQLRENELLRTRRPKFNTLNTYPRAHIFIGIRADEHAVDFCYTREDPTQPGFRFFGAFKTGSLFAYHALIRLLWMAQYQPRSPFEFPRQLIGKPPKMYQLLTVSSNHTATIPELLSNWFAGENDRLLPWLREKLDKAKHSLFLQNLMESDFTLLEQFYRTGAKRNRDIRAQFAATRDLILQEELDDGMVRLRSHPASGPECL